MIRVIVCERNQDRIQSLRQSLLRVSMTIVDELDVCWLFGQSIQEEISARVLDADIALISMQLVDGLQIAKTVHRNNSLCRILLFDGRSEQLLSWIKAGPVSCCMLPSAELECELGRLVSEIREDRNIFTFISKREKVYIPYAQIVCFSSNLRYIDLTAYSGKIYRFIGKLHLLENKIYESSFLRIHQSHLINTKYVESIDFSTHEVVLANGLRLPCSVKYYQKVCSTMETMGDT